MPLTPKIDSSIYYKAGIQHSNSLPPIPAALRAGATYKQPLLKNLASDNTWYQVPEWFTGKWKKETSICYFRFNFITGSTDQSQVEHIARAEPDTGWQRDRLGGIWQFDNAPYVTAVDCDDYYIVQYIKSCVPLAVSEDKVVLRFRATNVFVDAATKIILKSSQDESVQTYTPAAGKLDGFVKCVGSIKDFDRDGKPLSLVHVVCGQTRIRPFEPLDTYRNQDIKTLFRQYLKKRRLLERIP